MSKMSDIQKALEQTRATAKSAGPARAKAKAAVAPSREGRIHIGAYLHPDFKRSLRLVQAATGDDLQKLMAHALNELFRSHNVPVIGQD